MIAASSAPSRAPESFASVVSGMGVAVAVIAWVWPTLALPAALGVGLLLALFAPAGKQAERASLMAVGFGALLALKDVWPAATSENWAWIAGLPGALAPASGRQPEAREVLRTGVPIAGVLWLLVLGRGWFRDDRAAERWVWGLSIAGALAGVWIMVQPGGGVSYGESFTFGQVGSRNAMGAALAMAALAGLGAAWQRWREERLNSALVLAVAAVAAAWAVCALRSRGAVLALVVGGSALVGLRWRGRSAARWLIAPTAMALALVALWLTPQTAERVGDVAGDYRLQIWSSAWQAWTPVWAWGYGGGMFATQFALHADLVPPFGATFSHPDSSVVLWLFEHGAIGGVGLVAILVLLFRVEPVDSTAGVSALRDGARAAVVAWLIAGIFDIALHRAPLLALGLPLCAIAWPAERAPRRRSWRGLLGAVLIGAALVAVVWRPASVDRPLRYETGAGGVKLESSAAAELARSPLAVETHHALGFAALAVERADLAAKHFAWVMALQPANEEALLAYARALHGRSRALARPFWEHVFAHAVERGAARLQEARRDGGREPLAFWREVTRTRPDLLPVLADEDTAAAQRCFDAWARESADVRARTPLRFAGGAFARWGTAEQLAAWLPTTPRWAWGEGVDAADEFLARRRTDLAWVLLTQMVPRRQLEAPAVRGMDAELALRARPGDASATVAVLGRSDLSRARRLELLRAAVGRMDCPAALRIELAYELAAGGDEAAGARELAVAARTLHPAQRRDW